MRLKFKYTVEDLGEGIVTTHWKNYNIGHKLVGLKMHGFRPVSVEFSKKELEYIMENPNYLNLVYGALRFDN